MILIINSFFDYGYLRNDIIRAHYWVTLRNKFEAQQSVRFVEEHLSSSESLSDKALAWLLVALSENNLLVYCVQEILTDASVLRTYDSWVSLLYINKPDVLAALTTVYKNHPNMAASHPLVKSYQAFLEEHSRVRLELNRLNSERLKEEERVRKEEQKRRDEEQKLAAERAPLEYKPLAKE